MNILGISGTPRKGGNSEYLLNVALDPFEESGWDTTKILLSEKTIEPCIGCETCMISGVCHINDDMQEIYKAYEKCDAIIISAPAYWRNVPAQLKAVFDRTFAMQSKSALKGKFGGAISVGRGSCGGQSIVLGIIYNFYLSCGILCVAGELNGVSAVADKPGDILTQSHRLEQARALGKNILKIVQS